MNIVIFGLGSIGRRHAGILRKHFSHDLAAFRSRRSGARRPVAGIREIYTWQELEAFRPDAAFITNPTYLHIPTALRCAGLGMHLFIEKPLSHSLEGIARLGRICRRKKLSCYVAYGLRFHSVVQRLRQKIKGKKIAHVRIVCSSYLPDWRQGPQARQAYSGKAKEGGGVLLDLSHEFDYIRYLFGDFKIRSGVFARAGKVSVDAEDFADVLMTASRAPHINMHINYLSRSQERRIVIDHDKGTITADLLRQTLEIREGRRLKIERLKGSRDDYLKKQTRYFFGHIGRPGLMNDWQEAGDTLAKILEFKRHA